MPLHLSRRQFGMGVAAAAMAAGLPRRAHAAMTLKFGTAAAPGTVTANFGTKVFQLLEKKTNGDVKAQIFAATLGGEKTILDGVSLGTIDAYAGAYTGLREFDILYSPGFFKNGEQAWKVMQGPLGDKASKMLESKYKSRLLTVGRLGPYVLALKKKISSIDEVKGLKIRTPPIEGCTEAIKHLGANPTPVAFNEVYLALQQGVVDGFVSALNPSVAGKFYEPCKYVVANEFGLALDKMVISVRSWERLTAPQRDALLGTIRELEPVDYFKAGVDAVKKDLDTWRAANGPDSVLTLDEQAFLAKMRPLNEKMANDVFGPGSWDVIQRT